MRKLTVSQLIDYLEELPGNQKVSVLTECKACFKLSEENLVRFYRLDKYKRKRVLHRGYQCDYCGYLNTEVGDQWESLGRGKRFTR